MQNDTVARAMSLIRHAGRHHFMDGGSEPPSGPRMLMPKVPAAPAMRPSSQLRPRVQVQEGQASIPRLAQAFNQAISHHLSLDDATRIANRNRADDIVASYVGRLKDGTVRPLLGKNAKLMKTQTGVEGKEPIVLPDGRAVEATGLALAPAYQEGNFRTCPNSASCASSCLGKFSGGYFFAGGGEDPNAIKGPRLHTLNRTRAMLRDPEAFAIRLHEEINSAKREAAERGALLGVRLNVLSDMNPRVHEAIIKAHPDVAFYDYTKNNSNPIAPNHHYTYSSTGASQDDVFNENQNWQQMRKRLDTGSNVAMAFTHKRHMPEEVHDEETGRVYRVVNGDEHDFRPLDGVQGGPGVIIGLKNKKANSSPHDAHITSGGFFVHYDPQELREKNGKLVRGNDGNTIPTNKTVVIRHQRNMRPTTDNDGNVEA